MTFPLTKMEGLSRHDQNMQIKKQLHKNVSRLFASHLSSTTSIKCPLLTQTHCWFIYMCLLTSRAFFLQEFSIHLYDETAGREVRLWMELMARTLYQTEFSWQPSSFLVCQIRVPCIEKHNNKIGRCVRKPVSVSDQVRHKPTYAVKEAAHQI